MNANHFDVLARTVSRAHSRRHALHGLCAAALALGLGRSTQIAGAKRKKRKKTKNRTPPATPNAFGCLNVDEPCTSADQCCSGICEGTKGRRTCRAHNSGDCVAGIEPEACGEENESICTSDTGAEGYCGTTTGNAGYCAAYGECYPCRTDVECQRARGGFFGPDSACVKCTLCAETGGAACFMPDFP